MDFEKYFYNNLSTLEELISINSIYDESSVSLDAPYGKGVKDALLFMKELAIKDGFNVKDYDNEVLTINYVNNEKSRFDIASHLDVVSVDNSWAIVKPFEPKVIDGKLYGRGAADMKSALFLTYLALKLLRKNYPKTKNEIRLVLGTDEERTMNDMRHYVSKVVPPLFAFSPDGIFPMCIQEKGALMWTLSGEYDGVIEKLDGGIQCNVVSPTCLVVLKDNKYTDFISEQIKKEDIDATVKEEKGKTILSVKGIAVHCSRNFLGKNAIVGALKIISKVTNDKLATNLYETFNDFYGNGFKVEANTEDNFFTVNLGVLKIKNRKVFGQVDGRYPMHMNSFDLTNKLKKKCILNVSLDYDDLPSGCNKDDPYVQVLLNTYRDITNDNTKPIISGGVSYSKVFNHSVTFGPGFLYKENSAHQKDEYIEIEDAMKALEIYYETFKKLAFI